MTIEDLALVVKRGFGEVKKGFAENAKYFSAIQKDIMEMRKDILEIKERLENLEKVTLKQYNFELQELKRRVRHLEDLFAVK